MCVIRFGSAAVTRAVLMGRDQGLSVPMLPDPGPNARSLSLLGWLSLIRIPAMPKPAPKPPAPALRAAALAELAPFGEERSVEAGDILFRAGDPSYDFIVVLEGEVDIVRPDRESEDVLATWGAGSSSVS